MHTEDQAGDGISPEKLVGLLADESRLRALAAVALGNETSSAITAASGLDSRAALKALSQLVDGGLLEAPRGDGRYRVRLDALKGAARAIQAEAPAPHAGSLGRFIRGGRLIAWPAAQEDRLMVLEYLTNLFQPEQRYPEPQVNEKLRANPR